VAEVEKESKEKKKMDGLRHRYERGAAALDN
jgi:hypothetical protein